MMLNYSVVFILSLNENAGIGIEEY